MSYASEVLSDSPRAWWRHDEVSGLLQDSSGNGINADASEGAGSGTYQETGAITSDPTSKSIRYTPNWRYRFTDEAGLDVGDTFAIECWMKISSVPAVYSDFITKDTGAYELRLYNDRTIRLVKAGVSDTVTSVSSVPNDGQFHHIVATKNGVSATFLYIDSVDVTGTVTNSTYVDNASDLLLGGNIGNFINGWLDEVALYGTFLTPTRVLAHYNAAFAVDTGLAWIRA